jgi:V8-like Glu-specific endopeptidase
MPITREAIPTGQHEPVSNEPEAAADEVGEERSVDPSFGQGGEASQVSDDGLEVVPGYTPPRAEMRALAATPETGEAADAQRAAIAEVAQQFQAPDTSRLSDIAVASFGEVDARETVHGTDDRVQIMNTGVYPWRVHASLLITAADNSQWIGTGWFIGPHTLMTAGHVVHIKNSNIPGRDGWVRKIVVMPGRNGASLPYGSVTATSFRSVVGWTSSGDENYDYGAIILPTNLGLTTGWFGFGVWGDSELTTVTGNISGYPGDKPSGTQWYAARRIASVNPRKVFYDIDTAGGQSGSAVYRIINGGRYGIAIHAYGGATTNSGTRIVSPVFSNMVNWKA